MKPALDERLVAAARQFAVARYPIGWGGAAAMYTASGRLLISAYVDAPNEGASLCCETGCICEAHKLDEAIVATVCVGRESEQHAFEILAPCGLCMERLAYWGPDIQCAVPSDDDPSAWQMRTLRQQQPHRWDRWEQLPLVKPLRTS